MDCLLAIKLLKTGIFSTDLGGLCLLLWKIDEESKE